MKHIILIVFSACTLIVKAQEFPIYNNGLIYSEATMGKLKFIVDSLNLKFKRCDLSRKFYSIKQGKGHYMFIEGSLAKKALADIHKNIDLSAFLSKYKPTVFDSSVLICESSYRNYENEQVISLRSETVDSDNDFEIEFTEGKGLDDYNKAIKGNWVFIYSKATSYSKESIEILYLTSPLTQKEIPLQYAKMILYADCLVDTSQTVFLQTAKRSGGFYGNRNKEGVDNENYSLFMNFIEKSSKYIFKKYGVDPDAEDANWGYIDSIKKRYIKDTLSQQPKFKNLLKNAVAEAIENNLQVSYDFEYYTAEYYSKRDALTMKRNKIVVGSCSQDDGPRIHAMSIAVLSAESTSWEVFLRAHLDIMNDRFERVSDGSYAWGKRNTYIREIEELDIDMQELILGISLRLSNPSENHYYGSIGRLGRALAETKDRLKLEETILDMIQNQKLDDYNRLLMHYLFLNYTYYLPEISERKLNLEKLALADKTLPDYIQSKIKIDKKNFLE